MSISLATKGVISDNSSVSLSTGGLLFVLFETTVVDFIPTIVVEEVTEPAFLSKKFLLSRHSTKETIFPREIKVTLGKYKPYVIQKDKVFELVNVESDVDLVNGAPGKIKLSNTKPPNLISEDD